MKSKHSRLWAFFCVLLIGSSLRAQPEGVTGSFQGLVVDIETGIPLIGASVQILGAELSASTDLDGRFNIQGIPAGNVNISFARNGYQTVQVDNVVITGQEPASLELGLSRAATRAQELEDEGVLELEIFVVEFEDVKTQNMALLLDRQASASLSDAIGSDMFSKLGLGDAAEAMSKVTGASVVDGKYVVIRGLGDRYSNTLLNGSTVPSADPDRRAVQMDQFPSDLLESIVTSKSFTPDQPGSFSGGSVNIKTKSFPEEFFVKLGGSIKFDTQTYGEDILVTQQGVGWLADGADDRSAPDVEPGEVPSRDSTFREARGGNIEPAETSDRISNEFPKRFYPLTKEAPLNYDVSVSFGDTIDFGNDRKLGYTASFTQGESYSYFDGGTEARYTALNDSGRGILDLRAAYSADTEFLIGNLSYYTEQYTLDEDGNIDLDADQPADPYGNEIPFGVTESTNSVDWGAFGKLAYRFSNDHEVAFTLFHNQSADDTVNRGIGLIFADSGDGTDRFVESMSVLYTERAITSAQLNGEHFFSDLGDLRFKWQYSSSTSSQDQPDFRTLDWGWDYEEEEIWEASNNLPDADRKFREMEETRDEFSFDVEIPLSDSFDLKLGALGAESDREYSEDVFLIPDSARYWEGSPTDPNLTAEENAELQYNVIQNIYTDGTIGYDLDQAIVDPDTGSIDLRPAAEGRTVIEQPLDLVNNSNRYDGTGETNAMYFMGDWRPLDDWRFIAGARFEKNQMEVEQIFIREGVANKFGGFSSNDVLPAFSAVYDLRENMNLRFAYGRTVALPTFKELSPVEITNRFTGTVEQGNSFLERTLIDNLDLRWEWFLENGQVLAVSAFYKSMEGPIEVVITPGIDLNDDGLDDLFAGNQVPQNVEEGTVYGLEFEWRYDLSNLAESLKNFSVSGNLSFIESEVTVPDEEVAIADDDFIEDERQLSGQSPFLFNFDISYDNPDWGTAIALSYNYTDERLYLVNPTKINGLGNVFETSNESLNLIVTQQIGENWSLKFSAENLLEDDRERYYENLADGEDLIYSFNETGAIFGISVSYTFQ